MATLRSEPRQPWCAGALFVGLRGPNEVGHVEEPDDVAVVGDRLPAEQHLHAFEQRADAAWTVVGHRLVAAGVIKHLRRNVDAPFRDEAKGRADERRRDARTILAESVNGIWRLPH